MDTLHCNRLHQLFNSMYKYIMYNMEYIFKLYEIDVICYILHQCINL